MSKQAFETLRKNARTSGMSAILRSFKYVASAAAPLVLACCVLAGQALASDKVVGDTRDACDGHNPVTFAGKTGSASVRAGQSETVELPSSTREIYWYCAGTRERSANDTPFNEVQITRAGNGAIHWVFMVRSEPAGSDTNVRVGDTKDACDRSQTVVIHVGPSSTVNVGAGQIQTTNLPSLTRQIFWDCGKSSERAANPLPFNRVQLERAGNGAMQWVFYRTLSVSGVGLGPFIHDVTGDVLLPNGFNFPQPKAGILKTDLSQFWDANLPAIKDQVTALFPHGRVAGFPGTIRLNSITLSPSSQLEIRVDQSSNTLTMKPVVHGSQASVTLVPDNPKLDVNVTATFDLELILAFPRSQTLTVSNHQLTGLTLAQPIVLVQHVEIESNDPGSGILVGLLKANVRAEETQFDSVTQAVNKKLTAAIIAALEGALAPFGNKLPNGTAVVNLDANQSGDVRACPAILAPCNFAAPSARPASPRVLGASTDQCSQGTIWPGTPSWGSS